jgi:hypothetical protein
MSQKVLSLASVVMSFVVFSPLSARADTWGDQIAPAFRFTPLPGYLNLAVLDNETGLVWEQSPNRETRDWATALDYCNGLNLLNTNRKGWRLPTIQELASLVDPSQTNPALPPGHPFFVRPFTYWSASTFVLNSNLAHTMDFVGGPPWFGGPLAVDKTWMYATWCVRGGQGVNPQ